jgi:hypothetical protein
MKFYDCVHPAIARLTFTNYNEQMHPVHIRDNLQRYHLLMLIQRQAEDAQHERTAQAAQARTPTSCPPEMVLTSARYFFEVEIFLG